jgi:transcriptional regulator with XRE-family HTH domain
MAVCLDELMNTAMTISNDDRTFFVTLGARIAQLRKEHNITQLQLAQALEVSQQTIQAYEVGRRRIPVSALPVVAHTLSISLEELFGESKPAQKKRGPASQWQHKFELIMQLPKAKQKFIAQVLDTVLAQAIQQQ